MKFIEHDAERPVKASRICPGFPEKGCALISISPKHLSIAAVWYLHDRRAWNKLSRQPWRSTPVCDLTELTMTKNGYYNEYETERIARMREAATERSKRPRRSAADALAQMERLRQKSRRVRSKSYKTARKQLCETGRKRAA